AAPIHVSDGGPSPDQRLLPHKIAGGCGSVELARQANGWIDPTRAIGRLEEFAAGADLVIDGHCPALPVRTGTTPAAFSQSLIFSAAWRRASSIERTGCQARDETLGRSRRKQ